ncbi:hypothetical protein [Natrinema sp. 1APR25-10V2]|uniref:hypothetical protein n=1 Tax=Natrinema sp. 1APR25-10V2 TaxID=2951081 RepID=UPI00287B95E2|nr:hypothetical protein [Natrinema sp. 1APR25-10V2]
MTRLTDAAHERVTLPGCPLEERDDYEALTAGDARRQIPRVRPRNDTGSRTTAASALRATTDDRRWGNQPTIP